MLLSEILNYNDKDIEIGGIQTDSRLVGKGDVFVATNGKTFKGISFVDSAIKNGAVAIVCGKDELYENNKIPIIKVDNVKETLSQILKIFYVNKPKHIIGITGTSGKTSIAEFTRQTIEKLNLKSASIGSLGINFEGSHLKDDTLTMLEIVDLHSKLSFLKTEKNIDYVAMEFTSQGIDQGRGNGVDIEIGVFSNITPEHLDYHKDMADYLEKKMLLFKDILKDGSNVVLNADINEYEYIKKICETKKHKIITFGKNGDIKILSIKNNLYGQNIKLSYQNIEYELNTKFIGNFQVMNLLATLGIIIQLNIEKNINKIIQILENVKAADGRLEFAGKKNNGATIYIDYAHKPDALEKVLLAMKEYTKDIKEARVGVLFGCGGDRDKTKRPIMGEISAKLADFVIVTNDNCRTEDPGIIRSEIIAKCPNAIEIGDRKIAIEKAIDMLKPNDILILAGKGHEKYNIVGKEKLPFDEFEIVKNAINNKQTKPIN